MAALAGSAELLAGGVEMQVVGGVCATEGGASMGIVGASSITMSVRGGEEERRTRRQGVMI